MLKIDFGRPNILKRSCCSARISFSGSMNFCMNRFRSGWLSFSLVAISLYASVSVYFKPRSSSSVLMVFSPSRWASGAYDAHISESDFFGTYLRYRDGMIDVRLAAFATHLLVRLHGHLERLPDRFLVAFLKPALAGFDQVLIPLEDLLPFNLEINLHR